jgi:hypothetical protein
MFFEINFGIITQSEYENKAYSLKKNLLNF